MANADRYLQFISASCFWSPHQKNNKGFYNDLFVHEFGRELFLENSAPEELYTAFSVPVELYFLVQKLVKSLVQGLVKNPDELEKSSLRIWSQTWLPERK